MSKKSILHLFEETKNEKSFKHFRNDVYDFLPIMSHPKVDSKEFKEDLEEVKRCHYQPSLNTSFLKNTDDSIKNIYKSYCKENGIQRIDWDLISDIVDDISLVVKTLKKKNNRPRPINFFESNDLEINEKYKDTLSFPSGHTTIAYFICDIISHYIPEIKNDLQTIASLIGQSRIENAVHFPTDVAYGRLIGETLADLFLKENNMSSVNKQFKDKSYKEFSDFLENKKIHHNDIAEFLFNTNNVENKKVIFDDCLESAKLMKMGFPAKYITQNPHITSQINGLVAAYNHGKIDNFYKIKNIHEQFDNVLERGKPGELRNFSHSSPTGVNYPDPYNILESTKNLFKLNVDPWSKHVLYEWIHPFCDGNGRSGRLILLSDLEFNFKKTNNFIDEQYYIPSLVHFMDGNENKFKKILYV